MTQAIAVFAFGVVSALLGAWFYLDPRSGRLFARRTIVLRGLNGPALGMMYLPAGAGFMLLGLAFALGRNPATLAIFWLGVVAIAVGLILYLFHPRWAQPRWMKD